MSIVVTIAGVDRSNYVSFNSLRKRDVLNQEVDECSFETKKYGSKTYVPDVGDEIVVTRSGTKIFGGVVLRVTEKIKASTILTYKVKCVDYSQYLKRQLVTERYTNTTVADIIDDLVTNYTSAGDSITANSVTGSLSIASFSFNRLTVADCLQKLADAISYVWYIDYDKDIHFFPKNAERAPYGLSDTSENYIYNSLQIVEDLSLIKNSILVQGGEVISDDTRTEHFSGDGTRAQFSLANKYDTLPTVTVGGSPVTVGTEYLDSDASYVCMWNYNEKYLRFTSGNIPASGTNNIVVSGTYLYPIVVTVPAPASIAEFGTYEFAITDKSIRSYDEAISRALAELTTYQSQLYEGSFRTYTDGLRSGQVLTINSTQRGKTIDVLIQSVEVSMRDPNGDVLEYSVTFATLKSIGIIEYLQSQLRNKEVIEDDADNLLNYYPFEDGVTASDSLATPTTMSGPYEWGTPDWGYAVWNN